MNKKNLLLLLLIILFSFSGCEGLKQGPEDTVIKIKGEKEIFVASDIGRGSGVYPVFWCGNDAIVVYNKEMGIELIEVSSGKRTMVSQKEDDYLFNCSPDGKWVVYMDRASTRLDKSDKVMTAEEMGFDPELDVWPSWEGYVADLYRFEVATGKSQRFAVVRSDVPAWEVVSPDGKKAFLGSVHNSSIEMPEPKWEAMWFSHKRLSKEDWDWNQTGARWFKDSSGVVKDGGDRLYVEIFGEGGWAKRLEVRPEPKDSMFALSVDEKNGIYFLVNDEVPIQPWTRYFLYRCKIEDKELFCEIVQEFNGNISPYVFLPGGDIVLQGTDSRCIHLIAPGRNGDECIVEMNYANDLYGGLSLIGISTDGRRLAFTRTKKEGRRSGIFSVYEKDLFIIELAD